MTASDRFRPVASDAVATKQQLVSGTAFAQGRLLVESASATQARLASERVLRTGNAFLQVKERASD